MRIVAAAVAVGALAFSCLPIAAAKDNCNNWKAAVSAAQTDAFAPLRGAPITPGMYQSKLQFEGYTRCVVGITDGALLMCFLTLPNEAAGKEAYARAIASMQSCLAGWTPLELEIARSGPKRLAGKRLSKTLKNAKLQALVTLQGPAKAGSTSHVVALAIGPLPQAPIS